MRSTRSPPPLASTGRGPAGQLLPRAVPLRAFRSRQGDTGGRCITGLLDYMTGVMEQNAVVIVHQPDDGRYAWVTSATLLRRVRDGDEREADPHGEMGGGGYGQWDGKPMAQLVREVCRRPRRSRKRSNHAQGPRTCEYYSSSAMARQGRVVSRRPGHFRGGEPGQSHPRLPTDRDAVLLSRATAMRAGPACQSGLRQVRRAERDGLMSRRCAGCTSTRCCSPCTLEFWVPTPTAKAREPHRFTHYNLAELLKPEGTAAAENAQPVGGR